MKNDLFLNEINFECIEPSSKEDYEKIIRQAFFEVLSLLQVDLSTFKAKFPDGKLNIKFDNFNNSSAEGNIINIAPKTKDYNLSDLEWFELIFTHEFIHTVVEFCWGSTGAPLFWEGVPVFFADNKIKQRAWGITYHQHCKALMEKNLLIDVNEILGVEYYDKRQDWRIDLQAGSFTGFLVENFGITQVRLMFKNYKAPTPDSSVLNINSLLTDTFGLNLNGLQKKWKEFLKANVEVHPVAQDKVAAFIPITTTGKRRCVFCYCSLDIEDVICKMCQARTDIKIEFK